MTQLPPAGHPDAVTLAELDEGLVDADQAAAARTHLDSCAQCRAVVARLRTTRALLSTLPTDPMPPQVAARIDAALAAAPMPGAGGAATVVPIGSRRPRWRSGGAFAGAAAAVAAVAAVSAIVYASATGSNGGPATPAAAPDRSSSGATAGTFPVTSTGADYAKPGALATLVEGLVGPAHGPASPPYAAETPTGTGAGPGMVGAPVKPKVPAVLERLHNSRAAALDCAAGLANGAVTPVAVDLATYAGTPVAVFVLPTPGDTTHLDVWVVGPTCSRAAPDVRFWQRVTRPVP